MTTELFDEQLHASAPAVLVLSDSVAEYLLTRGHAAKISEIASQVGKRMGASAKLIRQTLANNPQFVGEERRWNLLLRTMFHRPLEGALQQTLRLVGKPLTVAAFSNEMAVLNGRTAEFYQAMLPSFLINRPEGFFLTPDGRWGLRGWLLDTNALDEEELLQRNFFGEVEEVRPVLEEVRTVGLPANLGTTDAALQLLMTVGRPLSTKVISFALWLREKDAFDPLGFYLSLLEDPRFHLLSGSQWLPTEQIEQLNVSLQKLSTLADIALEEEETWEGPYMTTPEDLNEIFDFLVEHGRSQKLSDLVETVFEYSKVSSRYQQVYDGLFQALNEDSRFQLVGQQTWTLPALVPTEVLQVSESLLPESMDPSLLPDPETDAELEDEGLENNLALWVHDPRYEDFGSEHEVELSGEAMLDETRVPVLFNHQRMGTLKLRQADMSFFPTDTPLACVTLHGDGVGQFQMWINNEELLIHGLEEWYLANKLPVGAMLVIRRGSEPDDFNISWDGEIDDLIAIAEERISTLLDMRVEAEEQHWSVYEIMNRVMANNPEGLHFLTLWAEVNVVRRTPKRVVASNLSSYHCYLQVSGTERWKLDERKIEQGRKKTKKKFIIE